MSHRNHPKIWFLRHGQTEWNADYRLQGQLDSPLTAQGIKEAQRQAEVIAPVLCSGPAIWVSPLGRARQTAAIALGGAAYRTDPRLMEIHAGRWQGMLRDEILAAHPVLAGESPTALEIYEAAEGGEGLMRFSARIADFLAGLSGPTVIVAHGLLGQVLRAQLCGIEMADAGGLSNDQGCVYLIENGKEKMLGAAG